ncbi:hypothetical protein N7491_009667, partial [Penicillium cf. griseofulvum]
QTCVNCPYGARLPYAVSATNRSGLIVIVETLFMTWMIIVGLIRLYMRLAINGPVKMDDVVVFTGSVIAIAHVGAIMDATSHGLGRSEDESSLSNLIRAGKVNFTSIPNPKFGLRCHSKEKERRETDRHHFRVSIQRTFLPGWPRRGQAFRMFASQTTRQRETLYLLFRILLGMVSLWTVASILAVALSCFHNTNLPWPNIVTILNPYLWALYLTGMGDSHAVEAKVGGGFCVWDEGPGYCLNYTPTNISKPLAFHPDASLRSSDAMIVTAALLHCSIMVSTIPCLKPFVTCIQHRMGTGRQKWQRPKSVFHTHWKGRIAQSILHLLNKPRRGPGQSDFEYFPAVAG